MLMQRCRTSASSGLSNLINAKVQDSAGNRLGHIQDFVVDPNSGKIQFAVLKLNGDLARGGDYTPVPWPLVASANANLNKSGEPKNLVLNVLDRNKLASAQKFNVNRWPTPRIPYGDKMCIPITECRGITQQPER